jgi:hypothetical protein
MMKEYGATFVGDVTQVEELYDTSGWIRVEAY